MTRGRRRSGEVGQADPSTRGVVTLSTAVALLIALAPVLIGTGRAPNLLDVARSTAWFSRSNGDIVQINGSNGRQITYSSRVTDGGPGVQVREDGILVYVLDDGRLIVLNSTTDQKVALGDDLGDQLLENEGTVYVVDSESGDVHHLVEQDLGRTARLRTPVGRAALTDNGILWVSDEDGLVSRVLRGQRTATVATPLSGDVDLVTVGERAYAIDTGGGRSREVTGARVGDEIRLGSDVIVPEEALPDGALVVGRGGRVAAVDVDEPDDVRRSPELEGDGDVTPPVVAKGQVVVVRGGTVFVLGLDDLRVRRQIDLLRGDAGSAVVRSRDGIVYVQDTLEDEGVVIDGRKPFRRIDLRPDPDVPSREATEPGEPPSPLAPPDRPDDSLTDSDGEPILDPRGRPVGPDVETGEETPGDDGGREPPDLGGEQPPRPTPPGPTPPGPTCAPAISDVRVTAAGDRGEQISVAWAESALDAGCTATVEAVVRPAGGTAAIASSGALPYGRRRHGFGAVEAGTWEVVVSVSGGNAVASAPFTVDSPAPVAPGAPTNLQVTPGDGSLTLSWSPGDGADSYEVVVGGQRTTVTATGTTVGGLANGVDHAIAVTSLRAGVPGGTISGTGRPEAPRTDPVVGSVSAGPPSRRAYPSVLVSITGEGLEGRTCTVTVASPYDQVPVQMPCTQQGYDVRVGYYFSSYRATVTAVDGIPIAPVSSGTAVTNQYCAFSGSGGSVTFVDNGETFDLVAGGCYYITCQTAGGWQSAGRADGAPAIPANRTFDPSPFGAVVNGALRPC